MPIGQPGFFVVDSTGRVTYEFHGQVFADGLEIPASVNNAAFDRTNAVNWISESGGLLAQIQGVNISDAGPSNISALGQIVNPASDTHSGQISLLANATGGNLRQSRLEVNRTNFDTTTGVLISTRSGVAPFTSYNRTLIDAMARSHYAQIPFIKRVVTYAGYVTAAGGVGHIGTDQWTVSRAAAGTYDVALANGGVGFSLQIPTVNLISFAGLQPPLLTSISAAGFRVEMRTAAGVLNDCAFTFITMQVG